MDESDKAEIVEAIGLLYLSEAEAVFGYARARLGSQDAEDVTSEVFHAAVVALSDGGRSQVTGAWLMSVARNKVVDRWRRVETEARKSHLLQESGGTDQVVEEWTRADRRSAVLEALDALPVHYRTALVMRHLDGQSTASVAEALSVSVSAAESLLVRARQAFRNVYTRDGGGVDE